MHHSWRAPCRQDHIFGEPSSLSFTNRKVKIKAPVPSLFLSPPLSLCFCLRRSAFGVGEHSSNSSSSERFLSFLLFSGRPVRSGGNGEWSLIYVPHRSGASRNRKSEVFWCSHLVTLSVVFVYSNRSLQLGLICIMASPGGRPWGRDLKAPVAVAAVLLVVAVWKVCSTLAHTRLSLSSPLLTHTGAL